MPALQALRAAPARDRRWPVGDTGPRPSRRLADGVAERLRLGQVLELLQRVVLDLADPLAGHAERAADLLERPRLSAEQPVAELDHLALAPRERVERVDDVLAPEQQLGRVERRFRRLVLDEVPE